MTEKKGALHGVRVRDLSRMLPGPYCSMILGDHGAEVIAVENRKMYQEETFFGDLYRNKYHISLDLKTSKGLEIFKKLAGNADVILEGFRPGVTARLGIDYKAVRHYNPGVVYCSISGYGQDGPCRDMPGHDVNYLARSGILGLIGEQGRPPVIPGVQVGDLFGGAMQAALGIMLALFSREKTGKGQYVDISMTDGLLGLLAMPIIQSRREQKWARQSDGRFCHRYAFYSTYATADGRALAIGAVEPKFWRTLCEQIDRPQYIPLQYEEAAQEKIIADLREIFLQKTMADWDRLLAPLDTCCCGVAKMEEVFTDELFLARGMIIPQQDGSPAETGTIGIPVKLSGTPGAVRRPPPEFGADTRLVLEKAGYSRSEIDDFQTQGVV